MTFSVEKLEGGVKNLFSGKKKWFVIGGIVLLLLLFVFTKKSKSVARIDEYPGLKTDAGSITGSGSGSGGVSSGDLSLIRDNFTQQVSNLAEETKKNQEALNAQIAQNNQSTMGMFTGLTDAIGKQQSSFQDTLNSMNADFSQQVNSYESNLKRMQDALDARLNNSSPMVSTGSVSHSSSPSSPYSGSGANSTQSAQKGETYVDRINNASGTDSAKQQAIKDAEYNQNRLDEIRNQYKNKGNSGVTVVQGTVVR